MRPLLRYVGGKWRQWKYLKDLIEGERYREYCVGGGAMLCRRVPTKGEVISDVNERLMNLYRVVKDEEMCWELIQLIKDNGEIGRREFELYQIKQEMELGIIWNSYIYLAINRFSWMSFGHQYDPDRNWGNMIDRIKWWHVRLRNVKIECRDVLNRSQWDGKILFLDPPYLWGRRMVVNLYRHEMTDADHVELLEKCVRVRNKRVIICGLESDLYHTYLKNWSKRTWEIKIGCGKEMMEECCWFKDV